ncbi:hypothetical protein [Streptomyces sp. NPDC048659]|uniref:hypothetical protein n=1 Tax=Streptomyces sp. NPDC048659 TaxID=3155489 RepID=UPI00341C5421
MSAQLVRELEEFRTKARDLIEGYQHDIDRLERKVAAETERRREAERNVERANALLRQGRNLEKRVESQLSDRTFEVRKAPEAPEAEELSRRLTESEADRATLRAMLEASEAERRAALRSRDALAARLQPRHDDEGPDDAGARALRQRLEASNFAGILERARQYCACLEITADPGDARKLDHHSKAPRWRARLADALAVMQIYAEAKNLARATGGGSAGAVFANLRAYCAAQSTPLISEQKISHSESQYARSSPRGRSDRTFRVPTEISPTGTAVMVEHIRIGDGEPPAPRLHFLDDTDNSGLVVVGYFGDHLINTQTN